MGFRAGLTVCLLLLVLSASAVLAAEPRAVGNHCLACHAPHTQLADDCVSCHRGSAASGRLNIAHQGLLAARYSAFTLPDSEVLKRGQSLLDNYACRRCHSSAGRGTRLAANLDLSQQRLAPEALDRAISEPVLFMPQFHFVEEQRTALINALLFGGQRTQQSATEVPLVVHFEGEESRQEFQFEKLCGSCHRALTVSFGGLGKGLIGPNLSGLLSPFYPANYGDDRLPWTAERLKKWLENPRKIRPLTQMPPLVVKEDQFRRIVSELDHGRLRGAVAEPRASAQDQ